MTTETAPGTATGASDLRIPVITWAIAGLVAFGIAWVLGLQAQWWQRVLLALPVAALAAADCHGTDAVTEVRLALASALRDLGGAQVPLAVAGGAWQLGLTATAVHRIVIAVVISLVAALYHYALHTAVPAGGDT
ncbi:hypothetical protein ACH4PU_30575 [Streptomyces sp. NPDC021100]|uniref:hypothetical protein n=1 Tax=Streptomyces sp. NPDC021100 TaxID=3365114 RepID=UPI00378A3F84